MVAPIRFKVHYNSYETRRIRQGNWTAIVEQDPRQAPREAPYPEWEFRPYLGYIEARTQDALQDKAQQLRDRGLIVSTTAYYQASVGPEAVNEGVANGC